MPTDITRILDRSSSMRGVRQAAIDGFNGFLAQQVAWSDDAHLSLVQFDASHTASYVAKPLPEATCLTHDTYQLGYGTALEHTIQMESLHQKAGGFLQVNDSNAFDGWRQRVLALLEQIGGE